MIRRRSELKLKTDGTRELLTNGLEDVGEDDDDQCLDGGDGAGLKVAKLGSDRYGVRAETL